jgi:Uma2 family endonuclease
MQTSPRAQPTTARPVTVAEWLRQPEEKGAELIGGRIVYKALPNFAHGRTQRRLGEQLGPFDRRQGGSDRPGGWWIASEVDILLGTEGVRPDVAGWRRDRLPAAPEPDPNGVITERPDWVAEVLSPSNPTRDLIEKMAIYHAASVHHYWILDPKDRFLLVYRHSPDGYVLVLGARAGMTVRAEPFEVLEFQIGFLFGDEEEEIPAANP